jgi:hypothetical protein
VNPGLYLLLGLAPFASFTVFVSIIAPDVTLDVVLDLLRSLL